MARFKEIGATFLKAITRSKISLVGAITVIILLPILIISTALDMQGVIQNPYFSFLIYIVIAPLTLFGILLSLLGVCFFKGKEDIGLFTYEYLKEQFNMPGRFSRIRKLIYFTAFITVSLVFLVIAISYTGFQYTDSVSFCGQFCHTVMEPEYITYQNSPHSRVSCVACHIGKEAQWFTKAKFSGLRQFYAVLSESYSKPIQTPIGGLRPNRASCEECHRPEKFHGDKLYIIDKFLPDEKNTHLQTALLMKIGSGGYGGYKAHGIHWHVSEDHQVLYSDYDDTHQTIGRVSLIEPDGTQTIYLDKKLADQSTSSLNPLQRLMDCMDCHNRPTHIFRSPQQAIDQKLLTNQIPKQLPFIKRQALLAVSRSYKSHREAREQIASQLRSWYQENYPDLITAQPSLLETAVSGTQVAYTSNVFPDMNINWNTYDNFIGHTDQGGCFRCHNDTHESNSGKSISSDCTICHIIIAQDQPARDVLQILQMTASN